MPRVSVKSAARAALREDSKMRAMAADGAKLSAASLDSFQNLAHKLGIGADNPMSTASYGFNPISRNRTTLEWIHRGSWLGGIAVDTVADDMTRAGISYNTELAPDVTERMDQKAVELGIWAEINATIRWGRLYGGAIGVVLIDGQDPRTPLRLETVGAGQFKGLLTLDRWMVEPALEDLVTELGPHLGLPKYYRVTQNAPALRGCAVHHTRVAFRMIGVELPYQQRLQENLWGISVLERLYDRMVGFDSATTGVAQLVYKSYLRTFKIKGLRDIVAAGGPALSGLHQYMELVRKYQGIEGITLADMEDEFDVQEHGAFSGLGDALTQLGQQLSGALGIPLVRLFGQSPAGLNSTGESDLRMYYDKIKQSQEKDMRTGVQFVYKLLARSEGVPLPPDFSVEFTPLWQLKQEERPAVAKTTTEAVTAAYDSGLISQKVALQELRQSSRVTGVFSNISQEMIDEADEEIGMPGEDLLPVLGADGSVILNDPQETGVNGNGIGQNGETAPVDRSPRKRKQLRNQAASGGPSRGSAD